MELAFVDYKLKNRKGWVLRRLHQNSINIYRCNTRMIATIDVYRVLNMCSEFF